MPLQRDSIKRRAAYISTFELCSPHKYIGGCIQPARVRDDKGSDRKGAIVVYVVLDASVTRRTAADVQMAASFVTVTRIT